MDHAAALLEHFGARLHGWSPGVTAYFTKKPNPSAMGYPGSGAFGEPLSFSRLEWSWLEPLLRELVAARAELASNASLHAELVQLRVAYAEIEAERNRLRSGVRFVLATMTHACSVRSELSELVEEQP